MRMSLIVAVIMILSLLLVACGGSQPTRPGEVNFKKGYGGIRAEFKSQLFPDELYQNSPLSLSMTLHNDAGYDVNDLKVGLSGFDSLYVDVYTGNQEMDSLEGRNPYNPNGGIIDVGFEGAVKNLLPGMEYNHQDFTVYITYDSKLEFAPSVCINPNLQAVYDAGCKVPEGKITFSGQGAPLAVTEVKQIVRAGFDPEVEFRLKLKNKGEGKVKKVKLGKAKIGNHQLKCEFRRAESAKEINFDRQNQQAELVCTKKLEDRSSYSTTLFVELSYDYELKLKKRLKILN